MRTLITFTVAALAAALLLDSASACGRRGGRRGGGGCATSVGCSTGCSAGGCASIGCASAGSGACLIADPVPQATLTVLLPADASLTVDDQLTYSTGTRRVFVTPPLEPGTSYCYTLTAAVTRSGVIAIEVREVGVTAGGQSFVRLTPKTTVISPPPIAGKAVSVHVE